jgi:hypothetical protein
MKMILSIAIVFILLFAVSCTKDYYEPPDALPENVSFSNDVIPIFNSNCISCHNGGSTSPDLTEGNAYSELTSDDDLAKPGAPKDSELYQRIIGEGSIMPPGGALSQNDINIIYVWIKEGALNN